MSYKLLINYEDRKATSGNALVASIPLTSKEAAIKEDLEGSGDRCGGGVPSVFQHLHPRLCAREYESLRHDVTFLHKAVPVCETCYLRFSAPQLGSEYEAACIDFNDVNSIAGTQGLDPERLRRRQKHTLDKIKSMTSFGDCLKEEAQQKPGGPEFSRRQSRSCPRLQSWEGVAVPLPLSSVLVHKRDRRSEQPLPPTRPTPSCHEAVSYARGSLLDSQGGNSSKARRVPPLPRGAVYAREIQAFAAQCGARAEYVLPSKFSDLMGGRSGGARMIKAARRAASEGRHIVASNAAEGRAEAAEKKAHVDIVPDRIFRTPAGAEETDEAGSDIYEDEDGEEIGDALDLCKWKFRESAKGHGTRSSSATTATPAHSACMSSLPSTRTSSRLPSASSVRFGDAPSEGFLRRPRSNSRPSSSPQLLLKRSHLFEQRVNSDVSLAKSPAFAERPWSSPQAGDRRCANTRSGTAQVLF